MRSYCAKKQLGFTFYIITLSRSKRIVFPQSVPEYDAPAMQGREAEEEVSCVTTVAETWREHDDGRLRKKVSM